jgi:hypothetical protein
LPTRRPGVWRTITIVAVLAFESVYRNALPRGGFAFALALTAVGLECPAAMVAAKLP